MLLLSLLWLDLYLLLTGTGPNNIILIATSLATTFMYQLLVRPTMIKLVDTGITTQYIAINYEIEYLIGARVKEICMAWT